MRRAYIALGLLSSFLVGYFIGNNNSKQVTAPVGVERELPVSESEPREPILVGNAPDPELARLEERVEGLREERDELSDKLGKIKGLDLSEERGIFDFSDIRKPEGSTPLERFNNCPEYYLAFPEKGYEDISRIFIDIIKSRNYLEEPAIGSHVAGRLEGSIKVENPYIERMEFWVDEDREGAPTYYRAELYLKDVQRKPFSQPMKIYMSAIGPYCKESHGHISVEPVDEESNFFTQLNIWHEPMGETGLERIKNEVIISDVHRPAIRFTEYDFDIFLDFAYALKEIYTETK